MNSIFSRNVVANEEIKQIGTSILLAGIVILAFWIRIQGVENISEGQFTGTDAYLYYGKHR